MEAREVLEQALVFLNQSWCKDALAKSAKNRIVDACGTTEKIYDKDGNVIDTKFHEATSWSMTGAILAAEGSNHFFLTDAHRYVRMVLQPKGFHYISDWEDQSGMGKSFNNKVSLEEVLEVFREAIVFAQT